MPQTKSLPGWSALLACAALALLIAAASGQAQTSTKQSGEVAVSPGSPSDTVPGEAGGVSSETAPTEHAAGGEQLDFMSMLFVFMLATFIGIGVIRRVSRLLHTPLMSLTNAISAISVVGAIIVAGGEHYPSSIRILGSIALFAAMTNIISGFLITDRMLKMFKTRQEVKA